MSDYLKIAKNFLDEAYKELGQAKQNGNEIIARDAAEKAWNAIVQATNGLFQNMELPVPKNHYERRKGLINLEEKYPNLKPLGLRDRFMARCGSLHEDCFYEGIYDIPLLEEDFEKVKKYIDDIDRVVSDQLSAVSFQRCSKKRD